ncbi:alpha-amylase [Compostibacter hankyongensis]|uniref:Alpha-amylase n=1 Tax=Compostibacter hankyongensis TaxID=1007089 RepID=A0ABP8FNZ3_9BACT
MQQGTLMQFFHWYYPEGQLWKQVIRESGRLSELGITAVWLPPAYKGSNGSHSVGYDTYDLYDLGEFDQKGSTVTRYGSRRDYIRAVQALHDHGIQVYADIVLNHKAGADEAEDIHVRKMNPDKRNEAISEPYVIRAYTKFTFPGRQGKYSGFIWDQQCFTGIDWDEQHQEKGIFKIMNEYGEDWAEVIETEKGNYDYLMYADIEFRNPAVREELKRWGGWYLENTGVDGFRLDALKHISPAFYVEWLDHLRQHTGSELFTVGEFWQPDNRDVLMEYMHATGQRMHLFDAPLHRNFHEASRTGKDYDLRNIFSGTLLEADPEHAVTLVDNHDTQPLQALESPVEAWFKPLAYALILLREKGYPCIFYPDLYGAEYDDKGKDGGTHHIVLEPCAHLEKMLDIRKTIARGGQRDYFDHPNLLGWTREGVKEDAASGCAVLISGGDGGEKEMELGAAHAGKTFSELTGSREEKVTLDENGKGVFFVNGGSIAIWGAA